MCFVVYFYIVFPAYCLGGALILVFLLKYDIDVCRCVVNFPFRCGSCSQDEFAEPADLDVNNKRRKSRTVAGKLDKVILTTF